MSIPDFSANIAERTRDFTGREWVFAEIARVILYDRQRAEALSDLGAALARAGDERAEAVFDQATGIARCIQDVVERAGALRDLADPLSQAGDERAEAVFDQAAEIAHSIQDDWQRAWALSDLAAALAGAGRYGDAFLSLAPNNLDGFLQALTEWAPHFEQTQPGLSVAVLREASRVAGWVRPDWQEIHELLTTAEDAES